MLLALYVVNKHLPPGDYRFMYPDFSACCSVTYALPVDHDRKDARSLVDIGVGEGFKPQDVAHYFRLLRHLIRNRKRFDFAHYFSTMLMFVGPWLSWLSGLPSLITVTGFGRVFSNDSPKYRLLRRLYWTLFGLSIRLSRGVLFQNHADLAAIARRFPQYKDKIFYIGSAVNVPVCREKDFNTPRLQVLLVARLLPDKGIGDFLKVAESLHDEDALEFVLVGPPSRGYDDLAERVRDAAERGVLTYLGELNSATTLQRFAASHIFYFPSSYGEGLARVMLEAGFARLCPIAYDIPSNIDLITYGRGFLTSVGETEQVIRIIQRLSQNRTELERQARAYQTFVVENYNMTAFARRQDAILERLFRDHRRCR